MSILFGIFIVFVLFMLLTPVLCLILLVTAFALDDHYRGRNPSLIVTIAYWTFAISLTLGLYAGLPLWVFL